MESKEGKPACLRNESCEKYGENRKFLVTVGQVQFLFSCLQIYTIETEDTKEDELVGDKWCEWRKGEDTKKTYNNTAPSKPNQRLGNSGHTVHKIHRAFFQNPKKSGSVDTDYCTVADDAGNKDEGVEKERRHLIISEVRISLNILSETLGAMDPGTLSILCTSS